MKRTSLLLLLPLLQACGGANGKTTLKSPNSQVLTAGGSSSSAAQILGFYPAGGNVSAVPSSVTVSFNTGNLDYSTVSAIGNYSIACGGNSALAVQGVNASAGSSTVAVSLPSITGLASGTICTFTVSVNVRDSYGNFVVGDHTVSYTIGTNLSGGGSWVPAATATYTSAVGQALSSAFLAVGSQGMVLEGLMVNGTQYVDGAAGVWATGFASESLYYGSNHGKTAGGFTQLSCPVGQRVTGVFGKAGAYIDSIGLICANENQTTSSRTGTVGGSGGQAFELSCPAGRFVTDLGGHAGAYLDDLYLGCR